MVILKEISTTKELYEIFTQYKDYNDLIIIRPIKDLTLNRDLNGFFHDDFLKFKSCKTNVPALFKIKADNLMWLWKDNLNSIIVDVYYRYNLYIKGNDLMMGELKIGGSQVFYSDQIQYYSGIVNLNSCEQTNDREYQIGHLNVSFDEFYKMICLLYDWLILIDKG